MTTLSFHRIAKVNPGITYSHTNPGIVKIGFMRYFPWYMRIVSHAESVADGGSKEWGQALGEGFRRMVSFCE
jgi:hypothetical protein